MRRKVRIFARISDSYRELLSISENRNGSLIIVPKGGRNADRGVAGGPYRKIKNQKYSVHANLQSADGGNTIHHTTLFADGRSYETHAYTLAIKRGNLWPVYYHNFLSSSMDRLVNEPAGEHFVVANYDPSISTLIFALYLAPADADLDCIAESQMYRKHIVKFQRFSVVLLVSFSQLPSMEVGYINHVSTSSPKLDGEKVGDLIFPPDRGLSPNEAGFRAETSLFEIFAESWSKQIISFDQILAPTDPRWLTLLGRLNRGLGPTPDGIGSVRIDQEDRMIPFDDSFAARRESEGSD